MGSLGFSYLLHQRCLGDQAQRLHGFVSNKATAYQPQSWLMVTPASHCSRGQACVFHSSSKSNAPWPRRPNRGPGSRLARLGFTFIAEPKALGTRPILPKPAIVVKNHHGFPKPQHSEYLPEQAGVFQNPACPDQSISLRRSVPQLCSGKCSLCLRLLVLSRTTGQQTRPPQSPGSSWPNEDRKPSLFAEGPSLASKAERVPDQTHSASSIPCQTLESQCHMTATSVGGKMHRKF